MRGRGLTLNGLLKWLGAIVIAAWQHISAIEHSLMFIMVADLVFDAMLRLAGKRKVSWLESQLCILSKFGVIIILWMCHMVEPHLAGFPAPALIAGYYIIHFGQQVAKDARLMGIPLPVFLTDWFDKQSQTTTEVKK